MLDNAYAMIDSGHGFKMLALGKLAAADLRAASRASTPSASGRFARGETHTASAGPYPWT